MATYTPQKKEDDAGATGTDLLVPVLGRRNDSATARANSDGDYASLATDSAGRVKLGASDQAIGHVVIDAGTALVGQVAASPETNTVYNGTTALTPKFAAIAAATNGDNTLVSAVTSKKIRVLSMAVVAAAALNIYFADGAATVLFGGSTNKIALAANGGFVLPFNPTGWFETAATQLLKVNLSSANALSGGLVYVEV
jgi:hypothetical protein